MQGRQQKWTGSREYGSEFEVEAMMEIKQAANKFGQWLIL